ncbi:hypothetical protein [Desulfovermiculus halophilus]|jgi:hypothetical protein|uniref:hypothetical protein n=1 Tax=Desulfovermiculus halophilus TaxID=339722 RepID=UPI000488E874|nr:hypothetical protein [Desulfovermiculus halophilus]
MRRAIITLLLPVLLAVGTPAVMAQNADQDTGTPEQTQVAQNTQEGTQLTPAPEPGSTVASNAVAFGLTKTQIGIGLGIAAAAIGGVAVAASGDGGDGHGHGHGF